MDIPKIGTSEKTPTSKYQVTLIDKTNRSLRPLDYPNLHRFFDTIEDRNKFTHLFETSILNTGGKLVHNVSQSHYSFLSFEIYDCYGRNNYSLTVYR